MATPVLRARSAIYEQRVGRIRVGGCVALSHRARQRPGVALACPATAIISTSPARSKCEFWGVANYNSVHLYTSFATRLQLALSTA